MLNEISSLATDLYELTMAAAYFENGIDSWASFELFVPALPESRGYLVAAGLERALSFIEQSRFCPADIQFLRGQSVFRGVSPAFFDHLKTLRFEGEVWAVPEGTPVFAREPLLRVSGPILQAQILETSLLSIIGFETTVASKAARVVESARGRGVVEFGSRHAAGPEAGVQAARAAYLAGCAGTSNVLAGARFEIPISGTMAHSFVMAYEDEGQSFADFVRVFPDHAVILLDTYDTLAGLDRMIARGIHPRAVRLDSGDLASLAGQIRRRLDSNGMSDVLIFATGDLDEYKIAALVASGVPIDSFGVGTQIVTAADQPVLPCIYKLVEIDADGAPRGRAKFSEQKNTYPSCKQVYRFRNANGTLDHDLIAAIEEPHPGGESLLVPVMKDGKRLLPPAPLAEIRENSRRMHAELPPAVRSLQSHSPYPVEISNLLDEKLEELRSWRGQVQK